VREKTYVEWRIDHARGNANHGIPQTTGPYKEPAAATAPQAWFKHNLDYVSSKIFVNAVTIEGSSVM